MRRSSSPCAAWLAAFASALGVLACSSGGASDVATGTNDGGANVGQDGAISATSSTGCPATVPPAGGPCSNVPAQGCEYGTGDVKTCNAMATCAAGVWRIDQSFGDCAEPEIAQASCPASKGARNAGEVCELQGYCRYTDGICGCIERAKGGELDPDAAPQPKVWTCYPAGEGCPYPRPRIGSACSGARTCDYGSCSPLRGLFLECREGAWVDVPGGGCPP